MVVRVTSILLACLVLPGDVRAQPSEADRLFEEGRQLAKDGKFAEACERFTRSLALERTVGTELNLADCHEKQGHLREAWQLFDTAATEAERSGDDKRAKFAHDRATAVDGKLVTIILKIAEPARAGLAVTIAGRAVTPAGEVREKSDPGDIAITATAPGAPAFSTTAKGAAGTTVTIDIPAATEHRPPPITEPIETRRSSTRVRIALAIGVGGGASALAALAFSLKGRSDYNATADGSHCMHVTGGIICDDTGDSAIAHAQRLADIGTGFAIGAGALVATSAVLYFTAPRTPVTVAPTATATSVGVTLGGRF